MPYATAQDFLDRFGPVETQQLTDFGVQRLGVPAEQVLVTALADASAEIDGYLVGRVATVPMPSPPAVFRVYCCDIARYRLQFVQPDPRAVEAYKAAVDYLQRVGSGKVMLQAPANAAPMPGIGEVAFFVGHKVMARESTDDCDHGFGGFGRGGW
jgi:phage gp36-like protein